MINKNEITNGVKLATMLNKDGNTFFVKKGSLVDELIKHNLDTIGSLSDVGDDTDVISLIEERLNQHEGSDDDHQTLVEGYAADIAAKTTKMVKHGIEVVAKEVVRLYNSYLDINKDTEESPAPEEYFDVKFIKLPAIAETPFMTEIMEGIDDNVGYRRSAMASIETAVGKMQEDFPNFLHTGVNYVDEVIDEWLKDVDAADAQKTILAMSLPNVYSDGDLARGTTKDTFANDIQSAIINMLFFRKIASLRTEEGDNIPDVTVNAFNNYRYWSYIAKRRYINYKKAVAEGKVIYLNGTSRDLSDLSGIGKSTGEKKTIITYEESIRKLYEFEVDITSILGYIVNGGNYANLTVDEVTKDRDRYANIWDSKVKSINYTKSNQYVAIAKWSLKKAYTQCYKDSIKEAHEEGKFDGDDVDVKVSYVGDLDTNKVSQEVSKYIDSLMPNDNLLLFDAAIEIVAGIRYKDYPMKDYLRRYINEEHNGFNFTEESVREIASDYIGRFLLDNVVVGEIE